MKIIRDLMEVYADHLKLPLLLIDINSNLEYYEDKGNGLGNIKKLDAHLFEMKTLASYLTKPTIISISDTDFSSSPHYLITPHFTVNASKFFIAAGPYWVTDDGKVTQLWHLDEHEIATKLKKMQMLFLLLTDKEKAERKIMFPNQFLNHVKNIIKCDPDLDFQQYVDATFDELIKLEDIDFLGVAIKDTDEIFTIQQVQGVKASSLLHKRFFPGEGLLGRIAVLGYEVFWSEIVDAQGADFFNRYGIFPKQVFAYPLAEKGNVEGILFAGSFSEHCYNERLLGILNLVVEHVNQKRVTENRLQGANVVSKAFEQLADLINLLDHTENEYVIGQKIIELFAGVNYRAMVYTVSHQKEVVITGTSGSDLAVVHQLARKKSTSKCYWHEGQFIHVDLKHFGFYTLELNEMNIDYQRMFTVFSLLERVLATSFQKKQRESVFDLLHHSMEGLDAVKYKMSLQALKVVEQWFLQEKLPYERYQVLINLCKVLPYSIDFLEIKISKTEEWSLFMECHKILSQQLEFSQMSLEGKMIAFLYNKLIQRGNDFSFLPSELYEQFLTTFKNCIIDELLDEHYMTQRLELQVDNISLTAREKEVLPLMIDGLNNKEIAQTLNISVHTVKNHVTNILKKLDVTDRVQLMVKFVRTHNNT